MLNLKRFSSALLLLFIASAGADIRFIQTGSLGWECVEVVNGSDIHVSWHNAQHKAVECAVNEQLENPNKEYQAKSTERIRLEIIRDANGQGLLGNGDDPTPSANSAPFWTSTPDPTCEAGVASTYDLDQHTSDPDGDSLTYALNGGSTTLPTGVTLSGSDIVCGVGTSIGSTSGVIIDVDDGTAAAVASSAFTIDVTDSGEEAADFTICDSGCDYTLIQDAYDSEAAPGVIFELRSTPAGTTDTWDQDDWDLGTIDGTYNNPITFRVRSGDTIVFTSTNETSHEDIIEFDDAHYFIIKSDPDGLQLGRDETLNGWIYGTGASQGRFGVEHRRWLHSNNDPSSHIIFDGVRVYGGSSFDSGWIDNDASHFGFFNCEVSHSGVNGGDEAPDRGGNNLTLRANNSIVQGCFFQFGGHDNLHLESPYQVARKNILDGSWVQYDSTAPGRGNRAFTMEGSKGQSPHGPNLVEKNVIRFAESDLNNDAQACGKFSGRRNVVRLNYLYDCVDGEVYSISVLREVGVAATNEIQIYNNTEVGNQMVLESTDINLGSDADNNYFGWKYFNNIATDIKSEGSQFDGSHVRVIRSNSSSSQFSNAWRDSLYTNNIFSMASGTFRTRLTGDAGSTEDGIAAIEAEWTVQWSDNTGTGPTFVSAGSRSSNDYNTIVASFELDTGSAGIGAGDPHTLANGAGTASSLMTVDNAFPFVVLSDPDTYDMQWFIDMGYDVPTGDCVYVDTWAAPVRLTDINYNTKQLVLASPQTWSNNDQVFLADPDDCTTVVDNQGAHQ